MESLGATKEETLLAAYNSQIANMPRFREALQTGKMNERMFSSTAWRMFQLFAVKSLFLDRDINFAKLCFYKCGLLDELLINKYDEKVLDAGIVHLTFALLSDDKELINRYAHLKNTTYEETIRLGTSTNVHILQCLIKEDWAAFEQSMEIMEAQTAPKFKMELDAAYYRAFAEKDKKKMEQLLAELLEPKIHKQRNSQQPFGDFISQPALGYAKLAWLKGIEVDVNSPLVPKELLPVKPLDSYRELDLFSDFK